MDYFTFELFGNQTKNQKIKSMVRSTEVLIYKTVLELCLNIQNLPHVTTGRFTN
jgi:hypothetical protein